MAVHPKKFPQKRKSNYKRIRSQIRSGDVLLCSGSGWFSKMIQQATSSIWSHVAFVMRVDAIDRVMVLESVEPIGVRTVPLSKYLDDYDSKGNAYPGGLALLRHTEFHEVVNEDSLRRLGQFAVQLFGYPYDKQEIAKIAARIASTYWPLASRKRHGLARDKEYICSEYVWECYESIGLRVPYDRRGFISPADYAKMTEMELTHVLQRK